MPPPPAQDTHTLAARRSPAERLLVGLAELGTAALLALVAVRVFRLDDNRLGIMIVTFLPWFLLPVYAFLGVGIGARQKRLIAAAALVVLAHVAFVLPELGGNTTVSAEALAAPRITVVTANALAENRQFAELLDEIAAEQPDIVVLQELDFRLKFTLRAHSLRSDLTHWVNQDGAGTVLLSRFPLTDPRMVQLAGRSTPTATITVEGQSFTVVGVHTGTPLWQFDIWQEDLRLLEAAADAAPAPVVMLGDFNSTMQHRQFRDLLNNADLRDGHREQGSGWGATWPSGFFFGPQLRLDHVLVGPGIEVLTFDRLVLPGSDHRGLVASLALVGDG